MYVLLGKMEMLRRGNAVSVIYSVSFALQEKLQEMRLLKYCNNSAYVTYMLHKNHSYFPHALQLNSKVIYK